MSCAEARQYATFARHCTSQHKHSGAWISVHALRGRHMVHLLVQGLVDDRTVLQHHLGILNVGLVEEGQRVLHPVDVVTIRVVLVSVRPTRLLAGLRRIHLLHGLVDQVLQLQSLDQIRVPDHAAILDADILVLLHDIGDHALARGQVVGVAVHRSVLLHADLQLSAQIRRGNRPLAIPDLVHPRDAGLAGIRRQLHRGAVRRNELGSGVRSLTAEDHQVEQGVCAQAVRAVHGGGA
mmetsp:Transcript_94186/g.253587  ORF Transcript_94186/g.253587 Transcript_94186/m.253587 type:complete len:237 (+) Transcript_94186:127-837(+)